ncbi:MAG: hypothetical protein V1783_11165 [Bacteroidota bacterium]
MIQNTFGVDILALQASCSSRAGLSWGEAPSYHFTGFQPEFSWYNWYTMNNLSDTTKSLQGLYIITWGNAPKKPMQRKKSLKGLNNKVRINKA